MQIELPKGKWQIILLDPPWPYFGDPNKMAAAGKHYRLMSESEILAMPIVSRLENPGIIFLWTTSRFMPFCIDCIRHWGLYYRGIQFVWIKTSKATGQPIGARGIRPSIVKPVDEFVVAASNIANGRLLPLSDETIKQNIFAPVSEHSRKPEELRYRIDCMYPDTTKLEIFARTKAKGWDSCGDTVDENKEIDLYYEMSLLE